MRHARTWSTAVGVGALALSLGMTTTAPANAADDAGTTSQGTTAQTKAAIRLSAGYLDIGLDSSGTVTGLKDSRTGTDHLAPGKSASLVSLVVDGRQVRPTKVTRSGNRLTFTNKKAGIRIVVKAENRAGYGTLEAVEVEGPAGADVQTLLWGPLPTSVDQTIGQTVGVVRDKQFAIGLRPLTDRTEGAWPQEYQDFGWENEVADNPDDLQVALPHALEEWSAAGRTPWGSVLRAFTFDYTKERARQGIDGYRIPVGPLPGGNGRIAGSKIALFGASPEMAPTVLSNIASGEHLPYPTQDGQWQKTAQASSQSFLVLGDLKTDNTAAAADFAKAAGMDYIYSLPNAVGPWQSTGHYQFNSSLGGSDAGAAAAVDIAKAKGVRLGVHTISNFVSLNDPYVKPNWSPDLTLGQRATLTRPMAAGDTTLHLSGCAPLASGLQGRSLLIGSEIVIYANSSQVGNECQVTGLDRGGWGTVAAAHDSGGTVARVPQNQYGGALGGLGILGDLSDRFSTIWNTTGIMSNSYDGLEGASYSGWGSYGVAKLVNGTYEKTEAKDGFVTETSRMTSNTWDALTRASWGEVGSTSMNQVFTNNAFYQANFLPGMLGWISLDGAETPLSLESKLARGAGLNAGVGFQTSVASLTKGGDHATMLLDTIKQWETARNLGAFTEAQKARFRDQSTNWHLTVVKPGQEWSLQELDAGGNPIGEPAKVVTPTPRLGTDTLPSAATAHHLYEGKVTTNTPATTRYEVTAGALPKGLRLNPDTGGIVGTPERATTGTFTITAYSTDGLPAATQQYRIAVRR
ncbi:Ig domain-containing protein (plasmid) [Embleya sp. NBC_00888]|uniref:Ig domain-containing protein n=1 Tax=Embleya sp. NBC_00888 TaxID=2975960 RepID=UPI002F90C294|nr:Ig domain-containing protein [Embleya sp. NBC_00888]